MKRAALSLSLLLSLVACGDDAAPVIVDAALPVCMADSECDDGLFCNGVETCEPDSPFAYLSGCIAGETPCQAFEICHEDEMRCEDPRDVCVDEDGDGRGQIACGGDDCDDSDPNRFPGNVEVCDAEGHDEDCDPTTVGNRDVDGDGFVDAACCNGDVCGDDCVDTQATVNPGATETCDGTDQDCDLAVDEGLVQAAFGDDDGDLHGESDDPILSCPGWAHVSTTDVDCDDEDARVHGLLLEVCDGADNDCDGVTDEETVALPWYPDTDGDGFGDPRGTRVVSCEPPDGHSLVPYDCDDTDGALSPGAVEVCDGADNDCDGIANYVIRPGDLEDDDRDGFPDMACDGGTDCDDRDPFTGPGMYEHCDGVDNDCDGTIDEDPSGDPPAYYRDADGDGVGGAAASVSGCERPAGSFVRVGGDCADDDPRTGLARTELCDGVDQDCDGRIDEGSTQLRAYPDADGDGFGEGAGEVVCEIPDGQVAIPGDCDGTSNLVYPGAVELCNDADDDCDGRIDEMAVVVDWYPDTDMDGAGDASGSPVASCAPVAGHVPNADDCDDGDPDINPGGTETCDGVDEDCDSATDEGVTMTYYQDTDMDMFGDDDVTMMVCGAAPSGFVNVGGDCDDGDASVRPGEAELCDDVDQDCDGNVDEGPSAMCVGPGYTGACGTAGTCACSAGLGDCNGTAADGCEATFDADPDNCGGCGMACGIGDGCTASSCDESAVVEVAPMSYVTCFVRANGSVACAGTDSDDSFLSADSGVERTSPVSLPVSAEQLDGNSEGGPATRCVLQDSGATIRCWGGNTFGQLGDGTTTTPIRGRTSLVATPGGATYAQISVGGQYACARRTTGEVDCWGRNNIGQLGQGDTVDRSTPTQVMGITDAVDLSAGRLHACVVRASGVVACWGENSDITALGDRGSSFTRRVPNDLLDVADAVEVEAGGRSTCARTSTNQVLCWGNDLYGELGDGVVGPARANAAPVTVIGPASEVSVAQNHACALLMDSRVACWGRNDGGELGSGAIGTAEPTPQIVVDEAGTPIVATAVRASGTHTCAALTSGAVACWGRNDWGRFGNGAVGGNYPYAVPMLRTY